MQRVNHQTTKHLARMATPMTHKHCHCYYQIRSFVRWTFAILMICCMIAGIIGFANACDHSMKTQITQYEKTISPEMKAGAEQP